MKKHIVLIASLPVLALGAVTGIALAKGFAPAEVNATSVAKGTITIDTTGGDWATNDGGQNLSVYFTDGTNEGWGEYVFCAKEQYLVEVSYDLNFAPTKMTAWRYSNWYGKDKWTANPTCTGDDSWGKWNTSYELAYSENANIVIGSWDTDKGCNYAEIRYAYIHGSHYDGGDSGSWGTLAYLNGVKLNGSNHAEYFGDYTFVQWQAFGVKFFDGDWCVNYTVDEKIAGAFVNYQEGGNIFCAVAGTYSLYFDRNSSSIYINDPAYALADEWAQTFLGTGDNACASVTMAGWSTFATSFGELSEEARNLMADLPYVDEKAEPTTYYAKAVQRYDYVLKRYGTTSYADFMGRVESGKLSLSNGLWIENHSNASSIWLLSAIGIIGVVTFGGLIYFSRKSRRASN